VSSSDGEQKREEEQKKPKVLLLEWLDPPYDGGHWIPDMIEWVGCEVAVVNQDSSTSGKVKKDSIKSKEVAWENIHKADPDVILVACCGFDLKRNVKDALSTNGRKRLGPLRAASKMFACNGDMNFARPGPKLMDGIAVVAECVYGDKILDGFDFGIFGGRGLVLEFERVCLHVPVEDQTLTLTGGNGCDKINDSDSDIEIDIEDLYVNTAIKDYNTAHQEAVEAGAMYYKDPETGYSVITSLAHQKRGKCCGSGCRHCPYDHQNVKDKSRKIKQPAFLYEGEKNSDHPLVCLEDVRGRNANGTGTGAGIDVKVLFFSGGKDSFLAIRAIVKRHLDDKDNDNGNNAKLCLVLLTTFDVDSRIIAHQEVAIEMVVRQAEHLGIPLIGVPMHRGTSESYVQKMSTALDVVVKQTGLSDKSQIKSLVFGDLHLELIRGWRDKELSKLGVALEYPLWKRPYDELYEDFQMSNVEAKVSAVTIDYVKVDEVFNTELMERADQEGGDMFGENGEFHTFANVMVTTREKALGL
jgi:ATP-binding cassette subfamily B (MDR/TAP) protein 1